MQPEARPDLPVDMPVSRAALDCAARTFHSTVLRASTILTPSGLRAVTLRPPTWTLDLARSGAPLVIIVR